MTELELRKAQACLDEIRQLAIVRAKEHASNLKSKHKEIETLEKEKRLLNARVNDLVISSSKHERENALILIAGLVFGTIVGATGAVIWMGLS